MAPALSSAPERQRQMDLCEYWDNMVYTVSHPGLHINGAVIRIRKILKKRRKERKKSERIRNKRKTHLSNED